MKARTLALSSILFYSAAHANAQYNMPHTCKTPTLAQVQSISNLTRPVSVNDQGNCSFETFDPSTGKRGLLFVEEDDQRSGFHDDKITPETAAKYQGNSAKCDPIFKVQGTPALWCDTGYYRQLLLLNQGKVQTLKYVAWPYGSDSTKATAVVLASLVFFGKTVAPVQAADMGDSGPHHRHSMKPGLWIIQESGDVSKGFDSSGLAGEHRYGTCISDGGRSLSKLLPIKTSGCDINGDTISPHQEHIGVLCGNGGSGADGSVAGFDLTFSDPEHYTAKGFSKDTVRSGPLPSQFRVTGLTEWTLTGQWQSADCGVTKMSSSPLQSK